MTHKLDEPIQNLIDEIIEAGDEVGLQVAAYLDGELIVDVWAGIADETTGQPVTGDTLFTSWSTTKGFVATCVHVLAHQGALDYDTPIAHYWPEFAANGKATATIRHSLTHTAGIPYMPAGVTAEMMTDWDVMCTAIASHEPLWPPGAQQAYHAWTYGWILGEVVRRIDGGSRPFGQIVREMVCAPLGIEDFYIGIPDKVEPRVGRLRHAPPDSPPVEPSALALRVMPPNVTNAETVNRPDVRRACIPGGGGIMNARAVARHYAMLAGRGELDGVRVLSAGQIDLARALQVDTVDAVSGMVARRALGYGLGGFPEEYTGQEFGHGGLGGSQGLADIGRRLSFGLTKNLLVSNADPAKNTASRVANVLLQYVG